MAASNKRRIPSSIQARVNKGVKFLDAYKPMWWQDINVEELDLASGNHCVLGQIYSDYSTGQCLIKREVALSVTVPNVREPLPGVMIHITPSVNIDFEALGFQAYYPNDGGQYPALTAAWKKVIRDRQNREAKRGRAS